jgi:hypothetical protein
MKHATLNLHNDSRLFLLEDFFPSLMAIEILKLFKTGPTDNSSWKVISGQTHAVDRYHYIGSGSTFNKITEYASSSIVKDYFSSLLNKNIEFIGSALWLDQAGYSIPPHYDLDPYQYAAQIYITDTPNAFSGTTVYNNHHQILAQLPLRNNFGYLIDRTTTVLHGIATPIPASCSRYSVYIKYQAT